jgi:hypothetical protein
VLAHSAQDLAGIARLPVYLQALGFRQLAAAGVSWSVRG